MKPGIRDVMFFIGLGLLGAGTGLVHLPTGLIVTGAIVTATAIFGIKALK